MDIRICVSIAILLSAINAFLGDDRNGRIISRSSIVDRKLNSYVSLDSESKLFLESGICSSESNFSGIATCDDYSLQIDDLYALKRSSCFCDAQCHDYNDCCIDEAAIDDIDGRQWSCRDIRSEYRFPMYMYQKCLPSWDEDYILTLCETEATHLQENGEYFNHLQVIPVHSYASKVIYRNIYCAVCNGDTNLTKWRTHFHCNGDSKGVSLDTFTEEIDFTGAIYNPRKNSWKVSIDGRIRTCRLIVEEFKPHVIIPKFGGRLCKSVIDTCPNSTDLERQCKAYSSYVYKPALVNGVSIAYKNFHCAECHNVLPNQLTCLDPYNPTIRTDTQGKVSLSLLFDFNFGGIDDNQVGHVQPCALGNGQIWDPLLRQCLNVTCGNRYKRKDAKCVLVSNGTSSPGMESDCNKVILDKVLFSLLDNGSLYVNHSMRTFNASEYEIYQHQNGEVVQVLICAEDTYFMSFSKTQSLISEITLSISVICLILHLIIYSLISNLRNCPGKVLMSLSAALLCGHVFLLLGPYFRSVYWMCYISGIAVHFGYLSAFFWMNVMAFDIHRTFSMAQTRSSNRNQSFKKYSAYSWSSTSLIVILSIVTNHVASTSAFSPKYGTPMCWFNQKRGLLIFFIIPVATLLISNLVFFTKTAFDIRKVSQQTKMVSNLSEKKRYYLYIKLSMVLGLAWIFGFLAALLKTDILWYPFIVLNGLQGALIFVVFTLKRKIMHSLVLKLGLRSRKYRMGKQSNIKKAMYSSLSNLSTLQTTLTTHVAPVMGSNTGMLKAVRKINPEIAFKESNS